MADVFRDNLLSDKVAVLTGGSSGINLRIAERFAAHGAKVALLARTPQKLATAVEGIQSNGGSALGLAADVRDYAALAAAFAKAHETLGPFDVLVCGAAGNFPAPAMGMSANGFKAVVDIDLLGTYNACRAAFEYLRKPGASIINISATMAFTPTAMQSHVCAAKAGVEMLTKVLAIEWGPLGIRINAIAPGPVDETEGMSRLAPTEELRQKTMQVTPLRRFATKDEVADLALFLCSDAAGYITGAVVVCDGGQSLVGAGVYLNVMGY